MDRLIYVALAAVMLFVPLGSAWVIVRLLRTNFCLTQQLAAYQVAFQLYRTGDKDDQRMAHDVLRQNATAQAQQEYNRLRTLDPKAEAAAAVAPEEQSGVVSVGGLSPLNG